MNHYLISPVGKLLASLGVLGALALGAETFAGTSVVTVNEEASQYDQSLSSLRVKATLSEKTHLDAVKSLVARRASGDEPTPDEWLAVETAIDTARLLNDTPLLQRLDNFIERMDATQKSIREDSMRKLIDYEVPR